jgi:hypothetical protein
MKEYHLGKGNVICELTDEQCNLIGNDKLTLSYYVKTKKGWDQKIKHVTLKTLQAELDLLATKKDQRITTPCLTLGIIKQ